MHYCKKKNANDGRKKRRNKTQIAENTFIYDYELIKETHSNICIIIVTIIGIELKCKNFTA